MKTDKELAVELAVAVIHAISRNTSSSTFVHKPINGTDIDSILKDCYRSVKDLDNGM